MLHPERFLESDLTPRRFEPHHVKVHRPRYLINGLWLGKKASNDSLPAYFRARKLVSQDIPL